MTQTYRYEFRPDEHDDIVHCAKAHGFAIVKQLLPPTMVDQLKTSVIDNLAPGGKLAYAKTNSYQTWFIERSPALRDLIRFRPFMSIAEAVVGDAELTVHRSAAIVRQPGDGGMAWHSDFQYPPHPPRGASEYLNTTPPESRTGSLWFYLTGVNPRDGGIAIIPDSHTIDWQPAPGLQLSPDRRFIHRAGDDKPCLDMNIPGAMAIHAEPGDLIHFNLLTYHGVYNHTGSHLRVSAALNFRRRALSFTAPWPRSTEAQRFIDDTPDDLKPYLRDYLGLDLNWRP
ncbi:MAG: phytanoyl-CoA dioxygenase family protein [Planctomycetota bacterium]|nr:phytanoyl-CoA dioxygenase family protein [Planctomycetota bacterium]